MRNREIIQEYKCKLRSYRYAPNTVSTYLHCVKPFLEEFESKDLTKISEIEVSHFINRLRSEKQISESYESHILSAVKKLYLLVFNQDIEIGRLSENPIKRIRPLFIESYEIKRIIKYSPNIKHQCIIGLLYSAGLRLEELINLKNSAIDFNSYQIRVVHPKTHKRRSLPLSPFMIPYLKRYRRSYANDQPIFEGYKNSGLCPRAVQQIVRNAAKLAHIDQVVTPTVLRNSFAIHLLQAGTRSEIVKELLGLESEQAMQKYISLPTW